MAVQTTSGPHQQVAMPAVDLRQLLGVAIASQGVRQTGDLAVAQRAAGANMSVDVAAGSAALADVHGAGGGFYALTQSSTLNLPVTAASGVNPRIDRVYAYVLDNFLGDGANVITTAVFAGTPTAGATLANCNGAYASSWLLLANILVPTSATSIVTANIDTTGAQNNSPVVRPLLTTVGTPTLPKTVTGIIPATGTTPTAGTGFTYTHTNGTGIFTFTFTAPFAAVPVVVATGDWNTTGALISCTVSSVTASGFTLCTFNATPTQQDQPFNFLAYTVA